MNKRGGGEEGSSTIFCRKSFVSQCRKFSEGNPSVLCFRKLLVPKKNSDKSEGEVSRFLLENFCLTVPKNAVGEPFSLSLVSGIEKVWIKGWGGGVSRCAV